MAKFNVGDLVKARNSSERYLELEVVGHSEAYGDYFKAKSVKSVGYHSELIGKFFDLYEGDYVLCDIFLQFEEALNNLESEL